MPASWAQGIERLVIRLFLVGPSSIKCSNFLVLEGGLPKMCLLQATVPGYHFDSLSWEPSLNWGLLCKVQLIMCPG